MYSVTFGDGFDILRDKDGLKYDPPQWLDNSTPLDGDNGGKNDHNYPYLYCAGKKLNIIEAKWKLLPGFHIPKGTIVKVKGIISFGSKIINLSETDAEVDLIGGWIKIGGAVASDPF